MTPEDLISELRMKPQCQCASTILYPQDHIHHKSIFYTVTHQGSLSILLPQGNASLHPQLYQKANLTPLNKINQAMTGMSGLCADREPFSHSGFLDFSDAALAI